MGAHKKHFKSVVLVLLSLYLYGVSSWKSCQEVPFCSTVRASTNVFQYVLDLDTINTDEENTVRITVTSDTTPHAYFYLTPLEDDTYHIHINDITPLTPPRHRATVALVDEGLVTVPLQYTSNAESVTVTQANSRAVIYSSPFRVEFYSGTTLVSVVNAQGKLVFDQHIALDVLFPEAQRAYGLPEHAEHLALRSTTDKDPYRHFNVDYANYQVISTESLYGSIPVLYGHATTHSSGVFWLNSAQTWVDISASPDQVNALFISETGALEMFVMTGPTLPAAIRQYTKLTGTAPLPQYFALAYHQSRYSYMSQDEVRTVLDEFDENEMPVDVVWLDIDYTEGIKYFTWDPIRFAEPAELIDYISSSNRKVVAIIDPHFKVDQDYFVHQAATEGGFYVKTADGAEDYVGDCWPGPSSYLDFTNPNAFNYYASLYRDTLTFQSPNIHIWNDMNEPAVFYYTPEEDDLEKTMPLDLLHFNNYQHRDVHNIYGLLQTKGTRQGLLARPDRSNLRPFILTRSHFAGIQRYAAIWTGDNYASWEFLRISYPMCLTEALAGVSFCGADIGGFMGIPDDELYQRWYQAGAWLPFYRGHSTINVPRREPYRYSGLIQQRLKKALYQRYAHLPVWYTLFYEHGLTGEPVIRPITYHYPSDVDALSIDDQILIGPNILAAPILEQGALTRTIYLPGGESEVWYNIDENYVARSGTGYHLLNVTLDAIPVFYKSGSIIPRKNTPKLSSADTHADPFTLYVVVGSDNTARGTLYVDDYETINSNSIYVNLHYGDDAFWTVIESGTYAPSAVINEIIIINPPRNVLGASLTVGQTNTDATTAYTEGGVTLRISNFQGNLQQVFRIDLRISDAPEPVPTTWWKSCWDVGYCNRLRNNPQINEYILDLGNLQQIGGHTVQTTLTRPGSSLTFLLTTLEDATFRITITDPNSNPPRHMVPEALNGNPRTTQLSLQQNGQQVTVQNGDGRAVITASPFVIEFYNGDRLMSVINGQQKFAIELERPNTGVAMDVSFPGAQRAYGLPSHAERLSLRSTADQNPYRHFNSDYAAYQLISTESLYGSIPVLYGHATTHSSGVFWLNSAQTWVDISNAVNQVDALFVSESGALDMFIMTGPTLASAVVQYSKLTGSAPLPQYFALGYHQSRYSYMTQEDVKAVSDEFDANAMPVDVIWLDIDYTEEKKYFTWDPERFSDPIDLQTYLIESGRKLVTIIDPHIKVDNAYHVHTTAVEQGYYIRNPEGTDYVGDCWPGPSGYLDFTNPDALNYYASLYRDTETFQSQNVHIWNDMNEPAVFYDGNDYTHEKTIPLSALHHNNYEHRDVHNIYGLLQTMGTRQGMLERPDRQNIRPFILTRAHFAGIQRFAAIWTGDNYASWEYLQISYPMCLTEALAGVSFCGADVGGFMGVPDDELFQRWFQAGAWLPFYRGHSTINVPRREPYRYTGMIQQRLRTALNQRYAHLPVWYTAFYEHERTYEPVIRPITYHYEADADVLGIDDQVLLGTNILAAPVLEQGAVIRKVYLPGGENEIWYNIDDNYEIYYGTGHHTFNVTLDSVPVFYRGGGIITRKDTPRPSTLYTVYDRFTLYVALDINNRAEGTLYVDDYESFDYQNANEYIYTRFAFEDNTFTSEKVDTANYEALANIEEIIIINPPEGVTGATMVDIEDINLVLTYSEDQRTLAISNFTASLQNPFTITLSVTGTPDENNDGDDVGSIVRVSIVMLIALLTSLFVL